MQTKPHATDSEISLRIQRSWMPRIVIVGGGFAGINLAKHLSGANVQLVLIDKNNYHSFQPLAYQVATSGLEPGAISSPLRGLFEDQSNFHFRMAEVLRVEQDTNKLVTDKGELYFDHLVLANGSVGNFFGNTSVKSEAMTINSLQGALTIREQLLQNLEQALSKVGGHEPLMNVIIVGGGPTGVELAGAIAELRRNVLPKDYPDFDMQNLNIHLLEGLDRLLPGMSAYAGRKAMKYLVDMGVKVRTATFVEKYDEGSVVMDDGTRIASNLLVWAAGVKGDIIDGFGDDQIEKSGLVVDGFNRVHHARNIYAIGDVAWQKSDKYPQGLPNLAPVAIQQGVHLARNFRREFAGKPWKPFRFKNKGVMATIGRNKAVVELPGNIRFGGRLGWFTWLFVHLLSILGLRRKLAVMAHWVWSYFTHDKGNRLILRQQFDNPSH